jgi:hypothetical protein
MNWEAIGAIAEMAGAIAVVVSLIYVAIQIRDNSNTNRILQRQNATNQLAGFMDLLLLNPELAEVHDKGRDNPEALSTTELVRFRRLMRRGFWYLSAQHQQYVLGAIGEDEWNETFSVIKSYLTHRAVIEWWIDGHGRDTSSPSFAELVDNEISKLNT